jgi:hypothetical protein
MTSVFSGQFIGYIGKRKFILNDVYYIPGVKKNIISVSRLLQQKFKIVFHNIQNKSAVSIYDNNGIRISDIIANNQHIFTIWISSKPLTFNQYQQKSIPITNKCNIAKTNKIKLWHRRLGHFGINTIKNKLLKININVHCDICSQSKLKKQTI